MIQETPGFSERDPFPRRLLATATELLAFSPAVVLLGPRQVGKTTLAKVIAKAYPGTISLDLQLAGDREKLIDGSGFLQAHRDRLVVLDEVQYVPEVFAQLRPEIDALRRPGRFLLLGSASGKLLRQSSESLAGRVSYLELTPLQVGEVVPADEEAQAAQLTLQKLWLRGGFPVSYAAPSDALSFSWRTDFIATFLNRDIREFGVNVPAQTLHRFWRMTAHLHGQLFNASSIAASLGGLSHTTVARYLDSLVDTMMLRRLEPHFVNVGKRLVKSPKVYVRDSGLLHALLNIPDVNSLIGHPQAGHSWEGLMVEQICALAPKGADVGFYRTAAGAELDVVVDLGGKKCGFEIKFSSAPTVTKGFWQACQDVGVQHAYVVAPVQQGWSMKPGATHTVDVISPMQLPWALAR
ncbi:MAG: ATP-binding protein [Burkholderiales bacterium]|nr:ATP-binding protein [Burkholderiales bacterium]